VETLNCSNRMVNPARFAASRILFTLNRGAIMSSITRKIIISNKSGIILFTAGIILCITMWAAMVWGDFEASLFATALPADKQLSTLQCPIVVARNESGNFLFNRIPLTAIKHQPRTYISQVICPCLKFIHF
jgi:hypothetical protein